jgi:DNA-binding response OmpR family regulator
MGLDLVLLTSDPQPASVLPGLALLTHRLRVLRPQLPAVLAAGPHDAVLVDARDSLVAAKALCKQLASGTAEAPVVAVVEEGGLVTISPEWGVDEFVLPTASPSELEARLRLLTCGGAAQAATQRIAVGELTINEATYTARLRGRALDLTYKEFELLKYLAVHAGRVFSREQLLREVWGYDFFGGTRTVDVHVRRLRAKLGAEQEQLIGTVRGVGYKLVRPRGATPQPGAGEREALAH